MVRLLRRHSLLLLLLFKRGVPRLLRDYSDSDPNLHIEVFHPIQWLAFQEGLISRICDCFLCMIVVISEYTT